MTISNPALYQYTESGLDYVWLSNGFAREETAYGPAVSVENATALHFAVAEFILGHRRYLTGQEVRFLRGLMDMTQEGLGWLLGKDAQSVARWEKSKTNIPPTEDRALRQIFLEHKGSNQPFTETSRQVALIRNDIGMITARSTQEGRWTISTIVNDVMA